MGDPGMTNCWPAIRFVCVVAAFGLSSAAGIRFAEAQTTASPVKHLIVVFQENVSFDHYFATYPKALNLSGETPFYASPRTPKSVNNLATPLDVDHGFAPLHNIDLLNHNP